MRHLRKSFRLPKNKNLKPKKNSRLGPFTLFLSENITTKPKANFAFEGGRVDGNLEIATNGPILFRRVLFSSAFSFPTEENVFFENCFVCANERTVEIVKNALREDWDLNVAQVIAEFRGREAHD